MDIEILNTSEVAKMLKSTRKTIERNARNGIYPKDVCTKHGGNWIFNKTKLLDFIFS